MPGVPVKPLLGLAEAAGPAVKSAYAAAATKYRPIIEQLKNILKTPSTIDPTDIALSSRVTPHKVNPRAEVKLPKGFMLPKGVEVSRSPTVQKQLTKQSVYEIGTGVQPIHTVRSERVGVKAQPGHSGVSTATPTTPLLGQRYKRAGESARRRGTLIDQDVRDIRAATGRASDVEKLAEKYGVSKASIRSILSRASYVHVK